ncbi:NuA4 histone acetyltransferase complex catalytic subunit [Saccharomycopsis crataegensis]|uniref:Histone acetyltransferase ESA1 n=1 Tax=Saccharomycopsis crataegensis TaxID=43959 RepID=A0AAV5QGL7_9ASCO|nr:NuA4 histone acetyltransferase complex catalytic subunit [Saccharomycopsis crataegensis]
MEPQKNPPSNEIANQSLQILIKGDSSTVITDPNDLIVGCKVQVFERKEEKYIEAEILSKQMLAKKLQFYVHFKNYNKRLDEWVTGDRIDLKQGVTWPNLEESNDEKNKKHSKKTAIAGGGSSGSSSTNKKKRKRDVSSEHHGGENSDVMDLDNLDVQGLKNEDEVTREDELKKLRTSGSMIQNHSEVAKVRNLSKILIGEHIVEPWYFSPYPIEMTEVEEVYICDFSLQYFVSKKQFERFRKKSTLRHPPGNEIYRDSKVSFFEIDGKKQRTWCRNLCLLSKLFLDHKTLYYDVDPFLFYVMTYRDEVGQHVVGYFSKEKESMENYNVACILTLPCYQRNGFGKLLIQFSYELSKVENKVGSPEKPLSDLGLLSYRSYWYDTTIILLMERQEKSITIDEISTLTAMTTTDILHTLQNFNMLRYYKGQHIIVLTDEAIKHYDKLKKKNRHYLDGRKLAWKPPVFTASQLRFGW